MIDLSIGKHWTDYRLFDQCRSAWMRIYSLNRIDSISSTRSFLIHCLFFRLASLLMIFVLIEQSNFIHFFIEHLTIFIVVHSCSILVMIFFNRSNECLSVVKLIFIFLFHSRLRQPTVERLTLTLVQLNKSLFNGAHVYLRNIEIEWKSLLVVRFDWSSSMCSSLLVFQRISVLFNWLFRIDQLSISENDENATAVW